MPLQLVAPERKTFHLVETDVRYQVDVTSPSMVTIKQATMREHSLRSDIFSEYVREIKPGDSTERVVYRVPMYQLSTMEVWLTLVDCNITTEKGLLFRFKDGKLNMSQKQFEDAWGELPEDIAVEIHKKVLEVNPNWILGGTVPVGEE